MTVAGELLDTPRVETPALASPLRKVREGGDGAFVTVRKQDATTATVP